MSQAKPKGTQKENPNDPFIQYLSDNRDDRALIASLRRGLGQPAGAVSEVSRIVECWDVPNWRKDVYYLIAPLFALHHRNGEDDIAYEGNMGSHFRELCDDPSDPPSNVERRFMQLLSSDANDLEDLLRQAISLLRSKQIAVNWQQLLADVLDWKDARYENKRIQVQRQWASDFWRTNQRTHQPITNPNP